ncbi:MAG: sugar-binding protein [Anaerolineae bacterium]
MRQLIAPTMLAFAALACALSPNQTDTRATVEAVYATLTVEAGGCPPATEPTAPTDESDPEPTATEAPTEVPTLTPTPPDERPGTVVDVARCELEIIVDGRTEDWEDQAIDSFTLDEPAFGEENWSGPEDASGEAYLCWTSIALYLRLDITDDVHVQTQEGLRMYLGDEVEVVFDGELRSDYYADDISDDDRHFGLSGGDFSELLPEAVRYQPTQDDDPTIDVAARRPIGTGGGYVLEAELPWNVLGVSPEVETPYGFCVIISDNDQVGEAVQESFATHCPDLSVFDPTTWHTLRLLP